VLVNGTCVCDAPWSDENCETMTFTPVRFPNGYGSQGSVLNKTLFFNAKGVATHLLNSVSSASQCYLGGPPSACTNCKLRFPDYTLIAELAL
jgi:hypothetical protein